MEAKLVLDLDRHAMIRIRQTLFRIPEVMSDKLQQLRFRRGLGE